MKNNYLLEGEDSISLKQTIEKIILENNFSNVPINTYDLDEVPLEKALEDLDTYGLFSTKKVIIISSIENINQEEQKKSINHLYEYIQNYNFEYLLIITARKLNNTLKITKELKKITEYIKTTINIDNLVKEELKDYKLENGIVKYLIERCREDINKIYNECNKLKNYKLETKEITKSDIDELVPEKLGDSTNLTFSFSRSLAERNKKEALEKYQELLNYNIEPLSIIGLLASQVRIMYQVKVLEKQSLKNEEIAKILQEKSSYRINKTKELTKYYSEKELLNLMISLADIDFKIKSSDVNPNFLIELFILGI